VGSERQKYTLELDVRCEDAAKKKKERAAEKPAEDGGKAVSP
jgi:hypothetical protein